MNWQPIETAKKDGRPIWAWLYHTGIRAVFWETAEAVAKRRGGDPEDYDPAWVEVGDPEEDWSPRWWMPYEAIPQPPEEPL